MSHVLLARSSRWLGLALAAVFATSLAPSVAGAAELKIGVVDLQKVLRSTASGKAAQKQFDDLSKAKQKALKKKKAALDERQAKLAAGKKEIEAAIGALNGKEPSEELKTRAMKFQDEARNFEKDYIEFERSKEATAAELIKKEAELLKPIEDKIRAKVELLAKEKGLGLILSRAVAVYASDALDITQDIIRRVDGQ